MEGYGPVSEIILAHHERIDGNGYPRRLKGPDIPALSRIISVADTYDVMTARDSYRNPVSSEEAIAELQPCAGDAARRPDCRAVHRDPGGQATSASATARMPTSMPS